jgi:hypothetical protein
MAYVIGALVRVKIPWTDVNGTPTDPTTTVCRVKDPGGTVSVYTYALGQVVREGPGIYHYDVATGVLSGWWFYRWEAAGAAVGAEEGSFHVEASKVI